MTTTVDGAGTGAELSTKAGKVGTDRRARAARAAVVIAELREERIALSLPGRESPEVEWRDLAVRQALIAARLGAWWQVLARTTAWGEVPEVFVAAVYTARRAERDRAQEAAGSARFWAARVSAAESGVGGVSR